MSRGELPQYENGYELIVVQRGPNYVAAGKLRGRFGHQPRFRLWRPRDLPRSPMASASIESIEEDMRVSTIDMTLVELHELVDHGGVRSFRGWLIDRRDEEDMVKHRDFTAILGGGQVYEGALDNVAPGMTRNNEVINLIHQLGEHTKIDLVSYVDCQYDRMVIGISGEKQPLCYIQHSQMIRMTTAHERAQFIVQVIEQALEERGDITRRKVNVQPVAEPEVVVAQLIGHTRKLNLGD